MNVHGFCSSLEAGIFNAFSSAQRNRQQNVDRSGPQAVDMLGTALRRERRTTAALRSRVAELEAQLAAAQDAITLLA